MPLEVELQLKRREQSGVKSVDLHPTEPGKFLASLDSGHVLIYTYQREQRVISEKSFQVTNSPVRSAKYIARKNMIITGADDMYIRLYHWDMMYLIKVFKAHTERIRCVAVHPTLPYVLSSSDDTLIKLWDWEKGWLCSQTFKGHSHCVMQVTFNPNDTKSFASASLDGTIKIWNLDSPDPNFTLCGHRKGVNCVDYFTRGGKTYLITGSDDHTAKVWDYENKSCMHTLEDHTLSVPVSSVCYHPEVQFIITGSECGTVKIWDATAYRIENRLKYDLESVCAVGYIKGSGRVVIGYDKGTVMLEVGLGVPVASMKFEEIIWANGTIQAVSIENAGVDYEVADGESLPLVVKNFANYNHYPESVKHSHDGEYVAVCGNFIYTIYTTSGELRSTGPALDLVWSKEGEFAVRRSEHIGIFSKDFQERRRFNPAFSVEHICGGNLLTLCSLSFIHFYDWANCTPVWRIAINDPVDANVYWAVDDWVAVSHDQSVSIFAYDPFALSRHLERGIPVEGQGVADSMLHHTSIFEPIKGGLWVGSVFLYIDSNWDLNYLYPYNDNDERRKLCHLDRPMYLLGYLSSQGRISLLDKEFRVVVYTFLPAFIRYKLLVLSGNLGEADDLLQEIPKQHLRRLRERTDYSDVSFRGLDQLNRRLEIKQQQVQAANSELEDLIVSLMEMPSIAVASDFELSYLRFLLPNYTGRVFSHRRVTMDAKLAYQQHLQMNAVQGLPTADFDLLDYNIEGWD